MSVAVEIRSDCALNYLNLTYHRYDGSTQTGTTLTEGKYDAGLDKFRYRGSLRVPPDAAPGKATAFAQPYCGPPEEYPASGDVPFTVDHGRLALSASPARVVAGSRVTVSGGDCDGPVTSVPLVVRYGDGTRASVTARVDARRVSATFTAPPIPGEASVSLARPDACPGSRAAGAATFAVRVPAATSAPPATASVAPSATVSGPPVLTASPETPEAVATITGTSSGGGAVPLALAALGVLAVAGAGTAWWLRRSGGQPS